MITLAPLKLTHALQALEWREQQPKCLRTRQPKSEEGQAEWWLRERDSWRVILLDDQPIGYTGVEYTGSFLELSFLLDKWFWSYYKEAYEIALRWAFKYTGVVFMTSEVYDDSETRDYMWDVAEMFDADFVTLPKRKGDVDSTLFVFAEENVG